MKSLLKNYIEKLTLDRVKEFAYRNDIKLDDEEFQFILDLVQHNFEDILDNEDKYLSMIEEKINPEEFTKVKSLYLKYKKKYKGYLF